MLVKGSSLGSPDYGGSSGWVESSCPSLGTMVPPTNQLIFKEQNLKSMAPLETRHRVKLIATK